MITNNTITYYHKILNNQTKLEEWERYLFNDVWVFNGKGSNVNNGYENANNISIRIPMEYVNNTSLFSIGDIVAIGVQGNIEKQSDLNELYNITSININNFGNNPHVHLGGV